MKKHTRSALSMFVVLCMLVASIPQVIFASDYENHWAKEAIAKWSEQEIVVGYEDGTFRPSKAITRGELSAILVRVFKLTDVAGAKEYSDIDNSKWYAESVAIVSAAKLIHEDGDQFRPEDPATREEAAYAIAKAYKISGANSNSFTDGTSISDWASVSVSALSSKGFLSGYPDGSFGPKRTLSRADVVAMLDKITGQLINVAGTYTADVNGNLVVNTRDVILKDMTISGNLYLTEGIGDGDVTLENITVEGETFVNGGGLNSIKSKDSKFLESIKVSAANPVRIVIVGDAVKIEAFPGTTVTLTGNFSDVILSPGVNVVIKDATVSKIFVEPGFAEDKNLAAAVITIAEGSTVKDIQADAPVETKGKGIIENLVVNSNGVKVEQKPTKTEIKDKDIKVNVAGKEETQATMETAKPSTPSRGGGGSSSSESESTTQPTKYIFSGKVTDKDGNPVEGANTEIYGNGINIHGKTNKDGNYSFYVPAKNTYNVNAWIVDENRYGYFTSTSALANSNKEINIELEKKYVANILVTDKNHNIINSHVQLKEVYEDKTEGGNWYTDTDGYATVFLWNENDAPRNFNIYIDDIHVGQIENVVRKGESFRSDYTVELDYGLGNTITGKAIYEDNMPASGVYLTLHKVVPINTQHSNWERVESKATDNEGNYTFDIPDNTFDYVVGTKYEENSNYYVSEYINALLVEKEPIKIRQSYSIKVNVTDKAGVGIPYAQLEIIDKNGSFKTEVSSDGTRVAYYHELKPGEHTVKITVGDQVMVKQIIIPEGEYNHSLDFQFGDVTQKTLNVKIINGPSVQVGETTLTPRSVTLADRDGNQGQATANFTTDGGATLIIPEDFKAKEATIFIRGARDVLIVKQDIILDGKEIIIDFANLPGFEFNLKLQTTTDAAITFGTAALHKPNGNGGMSGGCVEEFDVKDKALPLDIQLDLIHGEYVISLEYKMDGEPYLLSKKFTFFNEDENQFSLTLDLANGMKMR